eukprot:753281-Hanusia_phi.AAC.2
MPVLRPRTAASSAPKPASIGHYSFKVEEKSAVQSDLKVPPVLLMGRSSTMRNSSQKKQQRAELLKYKLRPGALEELGLDEDDGGEDVSDGKSVSSTVKSSSKNRMSPVPERYEIAPYGGKREIMSLKQQIMETESATWDTKAQIDNLRTKTQVTAALVEEKVGHVKQANSVLDTELVEIERQIDELKRISKTQVEEIKTLREMNRKKEMSINDDKRTMKELEEKVRDSQILHDSVEVHKSKESNEISRESKEKFLRRSEEAYAPVEDEVFDVDALTVPFPLLKMISLDHIRNEYDGRIYGERGKDSKEEKTYHPSQDFIPIPPWLSSSKPPPDWSDQTGSRVANYQPFVSSLPDGKLSLKLVHGYNGESSARCLLLTRSGKLVYPAASICVVLDTVNHVQEHFTEHEDTVIHLVGHPGGYVIASGDAGKLNNICIWDSETREVQSRLQGFHQGPVLCMTFSHDGNILATLGREESHSLCLWDWRKETKLLYTKSHAKPALSLAFFPKDDYVVCCGIEFLRVWKIKENKLDLFLCVVDYVEI